MNSVITQLRERYPGIYDKVPDDELTRRIGITYPAYLEVEDFVRDYKKTLLRQEKAVSKARSNLATTAADLVDSVTRYGVEPVANLPRTVADLGGTGSKAIGSIANYGGDVAGGAMKDLVTGQYPTPLRPGGPVMPNLDKALVGQPTQEDVGTSVVNKGLVDAAESLGPVAVGMAGQAVGIPAPLAFGGAMGSSTYARTGDPVQAAKSAVIGGLIPGVGQLGREGAAKVLGGAIERGLLSGERNLVEKSVEAVAAQGAIQAFMEGVSLPEYMAMNPDQRREAIARSLIANTAFMAMDVPRVLGAAPSQTSQQPLLQSRAAAAVDQQVNRDLNPVELDLLQADIDYWARRALDPNAPHARQATAEPRLPEQPASPTRPPDPRLLAPPPESELVAPQPEPQPEPPVVPAVRAGPAPEPAQQRAQQGTAPQPVRTASLVGVPVIEAKASEIAVRPALMQFKESSDITTGENESDKLSGNWDDFKAGLLLLWEPADPKSYGLAPGERYIIANGHHRLALGNRKNVPAFNAQAIREADGFSAFEARRMAAEINIADGKGTIYDQVKFIRNSSESHGANAPLDAARPYGNKARKAAAIAFNAEDPIYHAFINERITPDAAEAIALAAPNHEPLQMVGLRYALKGATPDYIANIIRAASLDKTRPAAPVQGGLPGMEDEQSWFRRMEERAAIATKISGEIRQRYLTVQNAARQPEIAAQFGVDVKDPEAVQNHVNQLKAEHQRWGAWFMHPDLVQQVEALSALHEPEVPYYFDPPESVQSQKEGQARRNAELKARQNRQEMLKRAAAPLTAKPIETTGDLFDPRAAENPLFAAPTPPSQQIDLFIDSQGIPDNLKEDAKAALTKIFQLDLFGHIPGDLQSPAHAASGTRALPVSDQARVEAFQQLLRDDPDIARVRAGFHRGVLSSLKGVILRDIPSFNIVGQYIHSYADLAALTLPLRTPYFEMLKVVVVNQNRQVVHSQVVSVGSIDTMTLEPADVVRSVQHLIGKINLRTHKVILSHNHPAAIVTPSMDDIRTTNLVRKELQRIGIVLEEHLITDGPKAWLVGAEHEIDVPNAAPAPWEVIERAQRPTMDSSILFSRVARVVRQANPKARHVVYLDTRRKIVAVETIPDDANAKQMGRLITSGYARQGAKSICIDLGADGPSDPTDFIKYLRAQLDRNLEILDVASGDVLALGTAKQMGSMALRSPTVGSRIAESSADYQSESDIPPMTNSGVFLHGVEQPMTDLANIRPIEFPEMVRWAKWFTESAPGLKRFPKAFGAFTPLGRGEIRLHPKVFATADQFARTLAHEIGHLTDYLPDRAMDRGNLLGRLATLRDFLRQTFPLHPTTSIDQILSPKDRQKLRRDAENEVGPRPPKDDETDRALWAAEVSRRYRELVDEEINIRGLASDPNVREELEALSNWWKPIPDDASQGFIDYRMSGVELYADMISVLFNQPKEFEKRAPTAWSMFFNYLDKKPEVKKAFFELQDLIRQGPEAVHGERIRQTREGFEQAEAMFRQKVAEHEAARNTFRGWWANFKQQMVDRGSLLDKAVKQVRAKGVEVPTWADPRNAWEISLFSDNSNFRDVNRIFTEVVQPLEAAGVDVKTLGLVLQYQRQAGNRDAQAALGDIAERLGEDLYAKATYAADAWTKMEAVGASQARIAGLIEQVEKMGIEPADVASIRELKAQVGTRAHIANPQGLQPKFAEETLATLLSSLGPDKEAVVLTAAKRFREIFFERFLEGAKYGIYSEATVKTAQANKDTYAAFRGLDHIDTWVTPMARRALGTMGEVENPFVTTLLKLVSLNSLIEVQKAKMVARDFFSAHFPDGFKKAETVWMGGQIKAKRPADGLERMDILENGHPVAYDVDPFIAQAFERLTPAQASRALSVLDIPFRNVIYPLIIKYNPGFLYAMNPYRDWKRTSRNLGAIARVGRWDLLKSYAATWSSAKSFVQGRPDALAEEMMELAAIGLPMDTYGGLDRSDALGEIMRRYRLAPEAMARTVFEKATAPAMRLARAIQYGGQIFEALPKFAGYRSLINQGRAPADVAAIVRNYVGTPNYRVKGTHGNVANVMIPFLNIFMQGYRADSRLASSPKTAAGWWFRWALSDGWMASAVGLAASGVLGAALKELYDGISEYDKTNYTCIPIGWSDGGEFGRRVIYMRLPRDEVSRFLSAVTYKVTTLLGGEAALRQVAPDVFSAGAGIVPTYSPVAKIVSAWLACLSGYNPTDPWRNRPVIPTTEFDAGGLHVLKPMAKWTLDQLGALNFIRYNPKAETTTELALSAIPGVNRLIKISDYGYREHQERTAIELDRQKALVKLKYDQAVRGAVSEYYHLQQTKERTPEQAKRYTWLKWWYAQFRQADEAIRGFENAGNAARAAEIRARVKAETEKFENEYKARK